MQHATQIQTDHVVNASHPIRTLGYNQLNFIQRCQAGGELFPIEGLVVAVTPAAKKASILAIALLPSLLPLRAATGNGPNLTVQVAGITATFRDNVVIIHGVDEFLRIRDLNRAVRAVEAWIN